MADGDIPVQDFAVDLDNCDREPIHVLGTVQPFGFLIALTADWLVSRVSANSADHIGLSPEQMLGQPISAIFSGEAVHSLRNRITLLRGPDAVDGAPRATGLVERGHDLVGHVEVGVEVLHVVEVL